MRAIVFAILLGFMNVICYPQAKQSINDIRNIYDEKGDYYFDKKDFKRAIVYYNMAYKQDAGNYYSVLKKAEAFTHLALYDQSAECYKIIFETKLDISDEHRLKYALLLLKNKDIKGFEEWMDDYNKLVRSEIFDYQSGTDIRAKMYYDSTLVIVENESVFNTSESEICPVICNDRVLFASTRKNLAGGPGSDYNLYVANYLNSGQLGRLNIFNRSINSGMNEVPGYCSSESDKFYFTRFASTNTGLKTYSANIPVSANDALKTIEFLPGGFTNIGHVTFNSAGTRVYFVSNAQGGLGGSDIYSSDLSGGKWSNPVNLGPQVNSGKDELYPFVLNDSMLYFTSSGHNSMGGMDIFSVNLKQKNGSPVNLGNKVNTTYDDFALAFSPDGLTGYFSSNRPGGFGKEDIYRLHLLNIKVKYAAFQFKKQAGLEDGTINLCLDDGEEHNIIPEKSGFQLAFLPQEDYELVIQHENPLVSNVVYNTRLTPEQKRKEFLYPAPLNKSSVKLQAGISYIINVGDDPIGSEYYNSFKDIAGNYENSTGIIDLTLVVKELQLKNGEIYTFHFIKSENQLTDNKTKSVSGLYINNKTVDVSGRSFYFVLPQKNETYFTLQTDLVHFAKNYPPKKAGIVKTDDSPLYKEAQVQLSEGFPILVNTSSSKEAVRKIQAAELTIIPGMPYVLSFVDSYSGTGDIGIDIPLTKGVKYNLGAGAEPEKEYNQALSRLANGQAGAEEELIDISVLSKELDVLSERDIVFNLVPAKQFASQSAGSGNVLTTLSVDGRKYFITHVQKMQVNLKIEQNEKIKIQTDLSYVKENFDPSTIAVKIDTTSVNKDLVEIRKTIITDPVYDMVVVNFNFNDYSIRTDAKNILSDKVINVLRSDSRLYVTIKGYSDPVGDAAHNERLSKSRALAVKDFLASNGIGENRIRTFSYGATQALQKGINWKDLSEQELEKYRKVEVVIYLPK
ncbi:MAG: OmpA family protein [Bacteroidales bacterium]|nr:OmpA family protein [Bacteroidales bacterium]